MRGLTATSMVATARFSRVAIHCAMEGGCFCHCISSTIKALGGPMCMSQLEHSNLTPPAALSLRWWPRGWMPQLPDTAISPVMQKRHWTLECCRQHHPTQPPQMAASKKLGDYQAMRLAMYMLQERHLKPSAGWMTGMHQMSTHLAGNPSWKGTSLKPEAHLPATQSAGCSSKSRGDQASTLGLIQHLSIDLDCDSTLPLTLFASLWQYLLYLLRFWKDLHWCSGSAEQLGHQQRAFLPT